MTLFSKIVHKFSNAGGAQYDFQEGGNIKGFVITGYSYRKEARLSSTEAWLLLCFYKIEAKNGGVRPYSKKAKSGAIGQLSPWQNKIMFPVKPQAIKKSHPMSSAWADISMRFSSHRP